MIGKKLYYKIRQKKIRMELKKYDAHLLQTRIMPDDSKSKEVSYIIHRESAAVGLFSYVITFMGKVREGIENGWIPVIDLQNHANPYLEEDLLGKVNAWEYYFEQPCRVTVDEVKQRGNYILAEEVWNAPSPYDGMAFLEDRYGEKTYWRRFTHQYIRMQKEVRDHVEQEYAKLIQPEDRVLGVLCRGTDYVRMKPAGHAIQPQPEQVIEKTLELTEAWKCNKIYLSTEDASIVAMFEQKLGDRLVYLEKEYVTDCGSGYVTEVTHERRDDKRLQGLEYLTQIAILSKCNCLLAGCCSGTVGAVLLSDGFEEEYYWDLGRYQ